MKPFASTMAAKCNVGKDEAQGEKLLGNAAYLKKDFKTAMYHYDNAILLDETELTFHSNRAAVYFQVKEFESCVASCEKAIEIGKMNKGDPKLISKVMARMGSAFKKLDKLVEGKAILEKALEEHKTPKNKKALADMVSALKAKEDEAYKDPTIAELEKNKGNERFKKGDFSGAVKDYTEAIRRNPTDPQFFSNRAACYSRLLSFDLALDDTNTCIMLDKNFIKGYIRKGKVLQVMGLYSKAKDVFEEAILLNPTSGEALEGQRQCEQHLTNSQNEEEIRKRALEDAQVKEIMADQTMQEILKQIQKKPKSIGEHMKNPAVSKKLSKLIEVGIVSVVYGKTKPHLDVS